VNGRLLVYGAVHFAADGSLKVLWNSQRWGVQFLFNKFDPPVAAKQLTSRKFRSCWSAGPCRRSCGALISQPHELAAVERLCKTDQGNEKRSETRRDARTKEALERAP
jgi:hypothetical protein